MVRGAGPAYPCLTTSSCSSSSLMATKRSTRRAMRPLGSGRPAFINGSSLAIQACTSASSSRVAPVAMIFAMTTSSSSPNSAVKSLRVSVLMAASQMLASADRHGDETHRLARSQPQQNNLLACVARFTERAFDLGRRLHRFAADLEDDVAKLKPALHPEPARLDVGDHDALFSRARDAAGRGELEPQMRSIPAAHRLWLVRAVVLQACGRILCRNGQFAERDVDVALFALAQHG